MIDTNAIQELRELVNNNAVLKQSEILELLDSHEELERKLKVAIETIEGEIQGAECDYQYQNYCVTHNHKRPCNQEILKDALKQIRGEG